MPDRADPANGDIAPWINREFLEPILRRDQNEPSLVVVSSKADYAVPVGDNYASFLLRVTVEYNLGDNKDTKERTVIVKSVPQAEVMQQWIIESGVFARELRMYHVVLPSMYKLYEELTGDHLQIGPKVCHTDRPNTIVLHDMRTLGYKMANRRQGLDIEHTLMATKILAKYHAISMVMNDKNAAEFDYFTEPFYCEEKRKMMSDFMIPTFNQLAIEVESWPGYERFGEKVRKIADSSVDECIRLAQSAEGSLKVLNHGDFWTNNMLFRYDDAGKIADVKMLDFQMIRFASPALDLHYFINMSCSQEVLENSKEEIIQCYLEQLNATLKRMNAKHLCVTRERLDREIKDKEYFAVVVSCLFSIIVADPEDAPDLASITQEDIDSGNMNAMNKAFAGKAFRRSFEKRLVAFEKLGLI